MNDQSVPPSPPQPGEQPISKEEQPCGCIISTFAGGAQATAPCFPHGIAEAGMRLRVVADALIDVGEVFRATGVAELRRREGTRIAVAREIPNGAMPNLRRLPKE